MDKRKRKTNISKITSFVVTPTSLAPASRTNLMVTIRGTKGAGYCIKAFDSNNKYYNFEPEFYPTDEVADRKEAVVGGWSELNSSLSTRYMSGNSKRLIAFLRKPSEDEEYTFYVEPRGDTVLSDGVATIDNPIVIKHLSSKTVSLEYSCSVSGVTLSPLSISDTITVVPKRKYRFDATDNKLEFKILISHASANVLSSLKSLSLSTSPIEIYKDDVLVDLDDIEDDFSMQCRVSDTTSGTTSTVSGVISVKEIQDSDYRIKINFDEIITTS